MIDIELSDKQAKQLSISITIDDVLSCIKKDIDSYLNFINLELENKEINEEEYKKELKLIASLKNQCD